MNKIYRELDALFDIYENEEKLSEKEIAKRCQELVVSNKFNRDFMCDLNDVIINHGYSFQFIIPGLKNKVFIKNEFFEVIKNATRAPNNTLKLIEYLVLVNDFRLTLSTLYALKIKHLITLNYLPNDNDYINNFLDSDLQMLFYYSYKENSDVYQMVLNVFEKIGIPYARLNYMEFRLDVERLLLTILEKGKGKTHLKVNTIKIAFELAPREYLKNKEKVFYEESSNKKINEYLKSIDKEEIILIKNKWDSNVEHLDLTGYKSLYITLTR